MLITTGYLDLENKNQYRRYIFIVLSSSFLLNMISLDEGIDFLRFEVIPLKKKDKEVKKHKW